MFFTAGSSWARARCRLPAHAIRLGDGCSDDPRDPRYNRPVCLPSSFGHELLWRADRLYDLVLVLGYKDDPPVPGPGSAIFLHRARHGFAPAEGCVALEKDDLRRLVGTLEAKTIIRIRPLPRSYAFALVPKIAVPTRTIVAPNRMPSSKSPLMPMLNLVRAFLRAISRRSAK
jgi:hypothetical protein